jgi:3-hydroxyacyl-[acyl-carrier-protein] dehydratase
MIEPRALRPLKLSAEVVRRLLPHRPPFLLVEGVTGFSAEPPALRAVKHVSTAEPVFAGHFPDLWLWPGAYTIEGLAQTCALLGALEQVGIEAIERGRPEELPAAGPELRAAAEAVGLLAAVDVKLTRPVFAGQRIDYQVERTHAVGAMHRFEVEASVDGHTVAKGTLTTALRGAR